MRLKHSVGQLAAVESRLNYCNNANLTDSNSNEANFSDRAIWDTIRPASILEGNVTKCPGRQCGAQTGRLDNRRLSGSGRTVNIRPATTGNRNELPRDSNLTEDDLAGGDDAPGLTDNGRLPASSSSSASSASSSGSASSSASPLASPASPIEGGIVNPNYPGFEHLAAKLLKLAAGSDCEDQDDDDDDDDSNNNNIISADLCGKQSAHRLHRRDVDDCKRIDPVNRDHADGGKALLYAKPKLAATMADAFLSSAKEELSVSRDFQKQAKLHKMSAHHGPPLGPLGALAAHRFKKDSNRALEERDEEEEEKYNREATEKELHHQDVVVPRKKEKMAMNQQVRKARAGPPGLGALERAERAEKRFASHAHAAASRREKRSSLELLGGFDVYNIETAMPRIDLDLIESHLRAAKEEERRRRNDREEIRRRLAMGSEDADYYTNDQRPGKKPSLQARLQSGMNLQICFMNETLSDTESPGSESEIPSSGLSGHTAAAKAFTPKTEVSSERMPGGSASSKPARPLSLPLRLDANHEWREHSSLMTEADFLARQAQLQTEARMALAQAKDMAHMQMEIERQRQNASPITEMVRHTLQKVGVSFPEDRRRLSRQILTEMNVAQLQVIVNDLHTQIEYLNESLVRFLMERDDLHMEQDSMLVDIEDLTRYLGAKEQSSKAGPNLNNNLIKSNGSSGGGRMNSKK